MTPTQDASITPSYSLIAVVGASADPQKYGHRIFRDLLQAGYQVVPINPKGGSILDQKVYSSLSEMPQVPDIVITVVPPSVTDTIVDEVLALGIKEMWMQPGSESAAAFTKAQAAQIDVHQACFMKAHGLW